MSKKRTIHTDEQLLLIQYLYGEEVSEDNLNKILAVPENHVEYKALQDVKVKLGNRVLRKHTPVPEDTIRRIFAAARPPASRFWVGTVRRPRRLILLAGMGAVTACVLFILFFPGSLGEPPNMETNQISDMTELQWNDTQDRIKIQQALSIVRQRTSPDLWDESEVMKMDSLQDVLSNSRPGVETVSTIPQ